MSSIIDNNNQYIFIFYGFFNSSFMIINYYDMHSRHDVEFSFFFNIILFNYRLSSFFLQVVVFYGVRSWFASTNVTTAAARMQTDRSSLRGPISPSAVAVVVVVQNIIQVARRFYAHACMCAANSCARGQQGWQLPTPRHFPTL